MSSGDPENPSKPWRISPAQAAGPFVREAGVPRRFGIGTLMLITAMYAVLFAVMRGLDLRPAAFLIVALFFTAIGLGQMLLFRGEHPRGASVLVGVCFNLVGSFLVFGYAMLVDGVIIGPDICVALACNILAGSVQGYLGGLIIAAVFLLTDKLLLLRDALRRPRDED